MPSDDLEKLLKRIQALEERVTVLESTEWEPPLPPPPQSTGEDEGLVGAYAP